MQQSNLTASPLGGCPQKNNAELTLTSRPHPIKAPSVLHRALGAILFVTLTASLLQGCLSFDISRRCPCHYQGASR